MTLTAADREALKPLFDPKFGTGKAGACTSPFLYVKALLGGSRKRTYRSSVLVEKVDSAGRKRQHATTGCGGSNNPLKCLLFSLEVLMDQEAARSKPAEDVRVAAIAYLKDRLSGASTGGASGGGGGGEVSSGASSSGGVPGATGKDTAFCDLTANLLEGDTPQFSDVSLSEDQLALLCDPALSNRLDIGLEQVRGPLRPRFASLHADASSTPPATPASDFRRATTLESTGKPARWSEAIFARLT